MPGPHPGRCQAPHLSAPQLSTLHHSRHPSLCPDDPDLASWMTPTSGQPWSSARHEPRDPQTSDLAPLIPVSPRKLCTRTGVPGPRPPGQMLWDLALTSSHVQHVPPHITSTCAQAWGPGSVGKLAQGPAPLL